MSKRNRREHGRILSVETMQRGSALDVDAAAGATSITVVDAGDFDEDGGWLYIGAQVVEFTAVDDDAGILTLAGPLEAAAEQGDPVHIYDPLYSDVVEYQVALVQLDGDYDNPDPVEAEVAEGVEDLAEGDRGRAGESCVLLRIADDEWEVIGVGGRSRRSRGAKWEDIDGYTLTASDITAGTVTFALSHRPDEKSVDGKWNGLGQEPTEYTVNYDAQHITWTLAGFEEVGDRLTVHYTYRQGITTPPVPYVAPTLDVTAPNMYVVPASLTSFVPTGAGESAGGRADTDLGHVGSYSADGGVFIGSNKGKAGPPTGTLPAWVPGTRFFVIGSFSDPHTRSLHTPEMAVDEWSDGTESGAPDFSLYYSSKLRSGSPATFITVTGSAPGTLGVEVTGDTGGKSALDGMRSGSTNVQVAAWGSIVTTSGHRLARKWSVNVTGVAIMYPEA